MEVTIEKNESRVDSDIESDIEFDTLWMKEIEEESKIFNDFFITENKKIKLYIYYINRNNELCDGKESVINIENGILKKSKLIKNIRKYMYV